MVNQTENDASTTSLKLFFTGWMLFMTPNHQCQSTEGILNICITVYYTSAHGSGRRYTILLVKFLYFFFFRQRISEMALLTGNLSSSDGRI